MNYNTWFVILIKQELLHFGCGQSLTINALVEAFEKEFYKLTNQELF